MAIASGHRVSSLHALCLDPGHVRWGPSGVRLIPRPSFIARDQARSSPVVGIFLPSISAMSSVEGDEVWCPVQTLKWYIDRTKGLRTSSSLFVSLIAPFREAS